MVDAHHNGVRVILVGCGNHDIPGTCLHVRLHLFRNQEHATRFAHALRTVRCTRDLVRVARVRQNYLLAMSHQGVAAGNDRAVAAAVDEVALHRVGQLRRVVAGIDKLQLHFKVLPGYASHLSANAPSTIAADAKRTD